MIMIMIMSWVINKKSSSRSQVFPLEPGVHVQVKSPWPNSVQVPAFLQGFCKQDLLTIQKEKTQLWLIDTVSAIDITKNDRPFRSIQIHEKSLYFTAMDY